MTEDEMRATITRLGPWHHDIEVAPGLRTGDPALAPPPLKEVGTPTVNDPFDEMASLFGDLFPNGLAGRSFLDCACNAGGHVFAASRHGASRGFGFDARGHWIDQANFLKQCLPDDSITFAQHTLESLGELGLEPFDFTLFKGIFYHLPDPMAQLRIAADLTKELIVVNTASIAGPAPALIMTRESTDRVMSGVDGLAWKPTHPRVVMAILEWCGFPHSRTRFWHGREDRGRFEVVAARDAASLKFFDSKVTDRREESKVRRALRAVGLDQ